MASNPRKEIAERQASYRHLSRVPYYDQGRHFNDQLKNLGYDYRGQILRKTTSPELWANPLQTSLYGRIEAMITFMLESAKSVKKHFSFAHDKDTTQIN